MVLKVNFLNKKLKVLMIRVDRKSEELFPATFCPIIRFRLIIFALAQLQN